MNERLVLKVGGSLMDQKDAPELLRKFLDSNFEGKQVNLLMGGGKVVDVLRNFDATNYAAPETIHWCCVDLLHLTYELAVGWLPSASRIETRKTFLDHQTNDAPGVFLLATRTFYTREDGDVLPRDWNTTSDSIAAFLAKKLSINRLVVLKSCDIPDAITIDQAASLDLVDAHSPTTTPAFPVQSPSIRNAAPMSH